MEKTFGLLELNTPILCKKEVLGKKFNTKVNDIEVNIILPSFNKSKNGSLKMNDNLIPPDFFKGMRRGNLNLDWGQVVEHPSGLSSIKLLALEMELEYSNSNEIILNLYNSAQIWGDRFIDYVYLITKQSIFSGVDIESPGSSLELFNSSKKYIPRETSMKIRIRFEDDKRAISIKNMKKILEMLSSGRELNLEYQLLLNSYYSRKDNNLRQAIIDAAASFEICLTKYLISICNLKGIDGEKLLKRRSLGNKVDLLEVLRIESDLKTKKYKDVIVNPRNDIVHPKKLSFSEVMVDSLLEEVNIFLGKYSPDYFRE